MLYSNLKEKEDEEEEERRRRAIEIVKQINSGTYNSNNNNNNNNINNISLNTNLNNINNTTTNFSVEQENDDYETRRKRAMDIVNQLTGAKTYTANNDSSLDGLNIKPSNTSNTSIDEEIEIDNNKARQARKDYINGLNKMQEENKKKNTKSTKVNTVKAKNVEIPKTTQNISKRNAQKSIDKLKVQNISNQNNGGLKNIDKSNMKVVTTQDIEAMKEAQELNKEISQDGTSKFNATMNVITKNLLGGAKQAFGGIANFVLTNVVAPVLKGAEGVSLLFDNKKATDTFNNWYNNVLDTSSDIKSTAEKESNVTARINDNVIKTAGQVTNTMSEMVTNAGTAGALGVSGTALQGISVAGRSTQEEIDKSEKNRNNILKAVAVGDLKGGVSALTETIFDANILTRGASKSSVQKLVDEAIYDHVKSGLGKEFANKVTGILGENAEELLEDNIDMAIDGFIGDEGFPTFEEWWNNTKDTAKVTTLSTLILSVLGLGGVKFENKEDSIRAEKIQRIVDNGGYEINFDTDNASSRGLFFKMNIDSNGNVQNVVATTGKEIDNPNRKVNISPAIVRNSENGSFNVIDSNTGVMIDSTPYNSIISAKANFNSKMINLDDVSVRELNNNIEDFSNRILLQTVETINNDENSENQVQTRADRITNNTNKLIASFALQEEYTRKQVSQIWNYMSDNRRNIIVNDNEGIEAVIDIEPINNRDIVVTESDVQGNILWESDVIKGNNYGRFSSTDLINAISEIPEYQDIIKSDNISNSNTSQNPQEANVDNLNNGTTNNISQNEKSSTSQNNENEAEAYIQEMATNFQNDVTYIANASNYRSTRGTTTKEIAEIREETGASLEEIYNVLDDIVNGTENNTELAQVVREKLDESLVNGYENVFKKYVAANDNYRQLKGLKTMDEEMKAEIDTYNDEDLRIFGMKKGKKGKSNNNGTVVEITTNIFGNKNTKQEQNQAINDYLKNELKGKDFYVDEEKIIVTKYTLGKLKNGKTNYDNRIAKSIKYELKSNIIANLDKILPNSILVKSNIKDTKGHTFADTFDRRKSIVRYKGQNYEVVFEIAKKADKNILYHIASIKKTQKNRLILPNRTTKSSLNATKNGNGSPKSNISIPQNNKSVKSSKTNINTKSTQNKQNNTRNSNKSSFSSPKNTNGGLTKNNSNITLEKDIEKFSKQVDTVLKGTFPKNDMLTLLSKTPKPLIDIGLTNLPITMTQRHLTTIMNNTGSDKNANYHGLGIDIVKQLPEAINNPLDIVQSNTRDDSVVLTTYLADNQNRTIVASIKIDGKGSVNDVRIDTNVMTSAYGRNNYDKFMQDNIKNGNLLYDIDRGVIKKVAGARLQLPRRNNSTTNNSSSINISIPQNNKSVKSSKTNINTKSMQNKQNNTNEDIRYMKKGKSKTNGGLTQTQYDNKGNELSYKQAQFFRNSKMRDEKGNLKIYYHGTIRADRVGNYFDPNKATSGPMAFFTDNKEVATNYSTDKQDTSLSREYKTEKDLFKINNNSLDTYWESIGKQKRNEIIQKGYDVGFDDDYELKFEKNATKESFGDEYEFLLKRNGNNAIDALTELFINSGYWTPEEMGNFKKVLDYVTGEDTFYLDRFKQDSKVYEVYLNITNPFDTSNISKEMLNKFEEASKVAKVGKRYSADIWDKTNIEPSDWIEKLKEDIKEGTTHSWTSIPDWVTDVLKKEGYDGIIDRGGKGGGIGHQVAVPFYSNQIKNINNTSPTLNEDIRYMKSSNGKANKSNGGLTKNAQNTQTEIDTNIQKELHNRIQEAITNKTSRKNTFLGNVTQKVVNKVKQLYGIDISGRRHILSDYDIRHMINEHGNPIIEQTKGQIAITLKDIEKIPDIINNYDRITKGSTNKDTYTKQNFNTVRYIKEYLDNTTYVVEVISTNSNQLTIKTMWKKPTNTNKKNNSSGVNHGYYNAKARHYTSETKPTSSYSTTIIPQNNKNVNKEDTSKRTNPPDEGLTNAERADAWIEQEIKKIEQNGSWDNSIPATSRSDIRKTIEDYLGIGVQRGHFREQAYAIYKGNRDVIRTKELKDMDSILHEVGHALDIGNRLQIDKESIADELLTAIDKLGGYEEETRTVKLEEGFAEVIREYSIIPKQAKLDYPKTIAVLEELRRNDTSFNDFITKVQQQTYNYIHQNPRNRVLSNQSIGKQTDKTEITKDLVKQEVVRAIWDKDYAIKELNNNLAKLQGKNASSIKASNNVYYLTRLASGMEDKVTSILANGYIDEKGNKLMPGLNKLGEILGNDSERFNDLRSYLVAQRDLEYKAKTLKTGIRTMDSMAVVNKFKNDIQIQEAAQIVYDTLNGVMQYAVNNGLISEETAKTLKESNAFYVPMHRVLNNNGNQVGRRGAVTDIIKARTGSELDVKDVLENIVANSANIIQQVENNNILKALYTEGEKAGLTGSIYDVIPEPMQKVGTAKLSTWENELEKQGVDTSQIDFEKTIDIFAPNNKIDTQNLITSFINSDGNRVYLQFKDELVFNSLMNMDKKFMSLVLKINSKLNMPLRFGATMANIGFAIPNMISDTAQAMIYSTAGFIPVVDNALGVLDILSATNKSVRNFVNQVAPEYAKRINTLYALYEQSGATNSTRLSQYRESSQNIMKDVYGTKNSEVLGIEEKWKPLKRLLDIMTYIPEISEQSTRFRVFERNYDYYKSKGSSEMDARILAALESRDATQDFGRTGNVTREINQLIPFSAARVGSAYTFAEKVKANPKQVGMRIAILTAITMAIQAMGYDDDEIEELNQRKKDDNFVFKIADTVYTIKKPQGILRSIVNLTEYIQDLATGHIEEGKEGERLREWLNNAIMDNMPADSITGLVPNAVAPLIENAINKDFYYNTDIVKSYDLDLPDEKQYYEYNSQLAILLGNIFNYSPAKIDNVISGYFGGLGTQITNIIDTVMGNIGLIPEKAKMGAEDNAVGKRFVVNVNENSASVDEVYTKKTELTKKKNGGTITKEEEEELNKLTEATSTMSTINKKIKQIKADEELSGEEKAEQIKELQKQKVDAARQGLGKDLIYDSTDNTSEAITASQFYPTQSVLSQNNWKLELTDEMKEEYEQLANAQYQIYVKQGLYSDEKLKELKSKCKDYAKKQLMNKYKSKLYKGK